MSDFTIYKPGTILVRNVKETATFNPGSKLTNLIFVSCGSTEAKDYSPYDFDECVYYKPNIREIGSGIWLNWGPHMVMTIDELINYIYYIKFIIRSNPDIASLNSNMLYDFSEKYGIEIANSIIKYAKMWINAIRDGDLKVPSSIQNLVSNDILMSEIGRICEFDEISYGRTRVNYELEHDKL